jgi:CHAD domain-containing protein
MPPRKAAKPQIRVSPDMAVGEGFALVLRAYFRALRRHESAIFRREDSEDVHDYRVALRAIRALLRAAGKQIPGDVRTALRADFRWLSQRSSAVRDLDVLAEALPDYLALVPQKHRALLDTELNPILGAARARYLHDLHAALRSPRYRAFIATWNAALAALASASAPDSPRLAAHVVNMIGRAHRAASRHGSRRKLAEGPGLHEFRKECKRLRYLLEAFQSLFEPVALARELKALKAVQNALGDYWDLTIHTRLLEQFAAAAHSRIPGKVRRELADVLTAEHDRRSTHAMKTISHYRRGMAFPALRDARAQAT